MALPAELRSLLFRRLPFTTVENYPAPVLRYWLTITMPTVLAHGDLYKSKDLTEQEWLLKIAAWNNFVGYTNQLFLPFGLTLLQAALAGETALFVDTLLRGQNNSYSAIAILRLTRAQPRAAEVMLSYLFAQGKDPNINTNELIDEILLGHVIITPRIFQLIGYKIRKGVSVETTRKTFFDGVHVALGGDIEQALGESATPKKSAQFFFLVGYLLAGGRNIDQFLVDASLRTRM
jgi:hypothetical protein